MSVSAIIGILTSTGLASGLSLLATATEPSTPYGLMATIAVTAGGVATAAITIIPKLVEARSNKADLNIDALKETIRQEIKRELEAEHEEAGIKLEYHPIFKRLDVHLNYINTNLEIKENYGKHLLVTEVLRNKISIWKDVLTRMAKEIDKCIEHCEHANSCNKIENIMVMYYNEGMARSMTFHKDDTLYTKDEQECIAIFNRKFQKWNSHRDSMIESGIYRTATNKYYTECVTIGAISLDIYQGVFAEMFNDIESTMGDINGDLKGFVFKGHLIKKDGEI